MSATTFPQKFGKYILLRKIAMGGMAEIFRAKTVGAEGFEKDIVIKRILPHYTEDEDFVKMFIDEATVTSKLQHANIVQIFDFNRQEGSYYIAMEYVEGKDLKRVMEVAQKSGKPLSVAQCVWIIMELAKGLHYAHTKTHKGQPLNIVHRDISPHNAMVSFQGEVKLMDFGIAKAASRSTKTVAGTVKGKCAYMSPEQARGKPLDGRSDLFALAIMLWEMLTGKRLFLGDSDFVTLSNVLKMEVPPASSINPEVPEDLDAILLKGLEKDRDKRHANVQDFQRDLTKWFYSHVDDLDSVGLGPLMKEMFAEDIAEIATQQSQEKTAFIQEDPAPSASPENATVALPGIGDPQAANTILDDDSLTADKVREAIAAAQRGGGVAPDGATQAMPMVGPNGRPATGSHPSAAQYGPNTGSFQQATGAFPQGYTGTYGAAPPKSKAPLIIALLVVLLGGGGAAAWWFMTQQGGQQTVAGGGVVNDGKTPAAAAGAVLVVVADPEDATVLANGKPLDDAGQVSGLETGDKVALVATKPGFKRHEEVITINADKQQHRIKLEPEEVIPDEVAVVIKPSQADAVVLVNGQEIGKGAQPVKGAPGTVVEVEVRPAAGGVAIKQKVTLSTATPLVEIALPEVATALMIKVDPSDAEVTADKGTLEKKDDAYVLTGVKVGDIIKIAAKKAGYLDATKDHTIATAADRVDLGLKRKPAENSGAEVGGSGTVFINAKPWAKVTVNGQAKGTTPVTIELPSGKHKIVLTKGADEQVKYVTVRRGQRSTVVGEF